MRNRNSRLSLAVLLVAAMTAGACSCGGEESGDNRGKLSMPGVTPDPTGRAQYLLEFGPVALETSKRMEVEVTNIGSAALDFSRFDVPEPFRFEPSEPFSIGINQERIVTFVFSPREEKAFEEVASLRTSAGEVTFRLVGEGIEPAFTCEPMVIDFGRVEVNRVEERTFTCVNNTKLPTVVSTSELRGNHRDYFKLGANANNDTVVPPNGSITVTVTFENKAGAGARTADFTIYAGNAEIGIVSLRAESITDALEIDPSCNDDGGLDFGYVPPGATVEKTLTLRNRSSRPIEIGSIRVAGGGASPFGVPQPAGFSIPADNPDTPEPENEVQVAITFSPKDTGAASARIAIERGDLGGEVVEACVHGYGGGPRISCAPQTYHFEKVAVGTPRTFEFVCTNDGTDDPNEPLADNLLIEQVVSGSDRFTVSIRNEDGTTGARPTGYEVGDTFYIAVQYAPTETAFDTTTIEVISTDAVEPVYPLTVSGNGVNLDPCEFEIVPPTLSFGIVAPENTAVLEFAVKNQAAHECLIYDVRAVTDGDTEVFFTEPADLVTLEPMGEVRFQVAFTPPASASTDPTTFTGKALFEISNPSMPNQEVTLRGVSMVSCVSLVPDHIDFGTTQPLCQSREREIQVANGCGRPVQITGIEMNMGPGCLDPTGENSDGESVCEFGIYSAPPTPSDWLGDGDREYIFVVYRPEQEGEDYGSISVFVQDEDESFPDDVPLMATMFGRGSNNTRHIDVFSQAQRPKVDILWVIDNSGSMSDEQNAIATNLPYFLDFALQEEIDFQLGVTTTDVDSNGEMGSIVPVHGDAVQPPEPRILTRYTNNLKDTWNTIIASLGTVGSATEKPLEAARLALELRNTDDNPNTSQAKDGNKGFIRHDAALSIVFVSDEPDSSPLTVPEYLEAYRAVKGRQNKSMLKVHGIINDAATGCNGGEDRMRLIIEETEGVRLPICLTDWTSALEVIGSNAFGFSSRFFLTNYPDCKFECNELGDPPDILVRVNNKPLPSKVNGAPTWNYHAQTNAIDFVNPMYVPEPGDQVEVEYTVQCIPVSN